MDLKKIIEKNRNNVKNMIKLITNEENEDLEQEVYVNVWQKSHNYKEQGKFSAWIKTVAKNISKDYLKSKHKKQEKNFVRDENIVNSIKDKSQTPDLKLIINERQLKITNAINSLKPKFKEIVLLVEIEGMSYEEVAKKISVPVGTVKSRLYNAKKELSVILEELI